MMYEAGFINLIKTICILMLIYYGFKLAIKYLLPFFLKKAVDKMQQKTEEFYKNQSQENIREGETVIDKKQKNSNTTNNDIGEYIDFEEID